MDEQKIEWTEIDCDGLAKLLANRDWEVEVKSVPEDEVYHLCSVKDPVTGEVELIKDIRSHWSSRYWLLVDTYKLLILDFQRHSYDDKSKSTKTEPDC